MQITPVDILSLHGFARPANPGIAPVRPPNPNLAASYIVMSRRIEPSHPDGLVPIRAAASACGCESDPGLIHDLVEMRLIDPVVVRIAGKRYVAVRDLDYIRAWVLYWAERPRRPKRRKKRR